MPSISFYRCNAPQILYLICLVLLLSKLLIKSILYIYIGGILFQLKVVIVTFVLALGLSAQTSVKTMNTVTLDQQFNQSVQLLLKNVSPVDGMRGSVSTSKVEVL